MKYSEGDLCADLCWKQKMFAFLVCVAHTNIPKTVIFQFLPFVVFFNPKAFCGAQFNPFVVQTPSVPICPSGRTRCCSLLSPLRLSYKHAFAYSSQKKTQSAITSSFIQPRFFSCC